MVHGLTIAASSAVLYCKFESPAFKDAQDALDDQHQHSNMSKIFVSLKRARVHVLQILFKDLGGEAEVPKYLRENQAWSVKGIVGQPNRRHKIITLSLLHRPPNYQ